MRFAFRLRGRHVAFLLLVLASMKSQRKTWNVSGASAGGSGAAGNRYAGLPFFPGSAGNDVLLLTFQTTQDYRVTMTWHLKIWTDGSSPSLHYWTIMLRTVGMALVCPW